VSSSPRLAPAHASSQPYAKRFVCLANSFKTTGRCLAGREILPDGSFGPWLRPVSRRPTAEVQLWECLYRNNETPKLLDLIEVQLLRPAPHNHQTENHVIDNAREWTKAGQLGWAALQQLVEQPRMLWRNTGHTSSGIRNCLSRSEAAQEHHSLVLIRTESLRLHIAPKCGYQKHRNHQADFYYRGVNYSLKLTDPSAIEAFLAKPAGTYSLHNVYLCISLTEPWEKDNNRCHKIVAAVFCNPPL
jgi:hypothetical protein